VQCLYCHLVSKNVKIRIYKIIILPVGLYGCETWSVNLGEEHTPRVFENTVLRRIYGMKGDEVGPPLWSSGQSSWLQILRSRVRFPALPDFLRNSGSGTGSTQPHEDY
jgi:hypothetical protein